MGQWGHHGRTWQVGGESNFWSCRSINLGTSVYSQSVFIKNEALYATVNSMLISKLFQRNLIMLFNLKCRRFDASNKCAMFTYGWSHEIQISHSEDRASWYILIMKANEMHYSSHLFEKVLHMFRTCPLTIIRSISTLYTRNRHLKF